MFSLLFMFGLVMVLLDAVPGFRFDPPGLNVSENKCQQDNRDQDADNVHYFYLISWAGE